MMTILFVLLLALVVSALVLALLLRLAPHTGLMDHPGERRRLHREAVPRIGGLAVFAGILASLAVGPPLTAAQGYALAGAALLVLVGALDDRFRLGPRRHLLAQIGAGLEHRQGGVIHPDGDSRLPAGLSLELGERRDLADRFGRAEIQVTPSWFSGLLAAFSGSKSIAMS